MSTYSVLIDQSVYTVPEFTLECGVILKDVPVAYKTWGKLNETKDNVMVICHAFTGSADVEDWWGPLMGRGKAFDPNRFFIICLNTLGSPYGSASPVTINPDTGKHYGPEFPPTSIRDDVRIHKITLDSLSIRSIAVVIGGSMGGMAVLEWPLCTPANYVRRIIPLATSARHSAWCISWGEAQRQSIYADPAYQDGWYPPGTQPASGLAAARMAALLTYRSRDSFESRFGRKAQVVPSANGGRSGLSTPPASPKLKSNPDDAVSVHNDGLRSPAKANSTSTSEAENAGTTSTNKPTIFSAQSYLRYQGDKFTARFDANCYIHITRKLDTHDLARDRFLSTSESKRFIDLSDISPSDSASLSDSDIKPIDLPTVLSYLPPRPLVISIASDGLFTPHEQREIAQHAPEAELVLIQSPDGHDGFLLEFEQINRYVLGYLRREFGEYYEGREGGEEADKEGGEVEGDFSIKKTSVFGEAEVDVTRW